MQYVFTFKTDRPSLRHLNGKQCTIVRPLPRPREDHMTNRIGEALDVPMIEARVYSWADEGSGESYTETLVNALYDELTLASC